ncbi:MAG: class I SAM-dependent methyltransferase [Planctomycetota bacterium]|nr:class I SAM-dependent methyltransferase [Planctomycetota bacterium]
MAHHDRERATESRIYQLPRCYDLAFGQDLPIEGTLVEQCFRDHVSYPVRTVLEPGCGTGLVVLLLAQRGFRVTGYDLSPDMVAYARERIGKTGVKDLATVVVADMCTARFREPFDSALNVNDTLGYLVTDEDIISHLRNTADAIKPGGIYIVSVSCAWDDLSSDEWEISWEISEDGITGRAEWDVEEQDWNKKLSHQVFRMQVNDHGKQYKLEERHTMRLWYLDDLRRLIRESGRFELEGIYNHLYEPVPMTSHINGEMDQLLYVLRAV